MKKVIQNPNGFLVVDSWNEGEQVYFNSDELPTEDEINIKNQYSTAISWLNEMEVMPDNPTIDNITQARNVIYAIIEKMKQLAIIEEKHLKFHKTQRDLNIN